jgi:hypothetical protein
VNPDSSGWGSEKFMSRGWTGRAWTAILHGLSGYQVDNRKQRVTLWRIKKGKVLPGTDATATRIIGV